MTTHEERMCELQADFFEQSKAHFPCSSAKFVERFMRSQVAKQLDNTHDDYNYLSVGEVFSSLEESYPSLKEGHGNQFPTHVLRWMGYIYRCFCIRKKRPSLLVYKKIKTDSLFALYDSFHTFDPDYCVDRIEEIILQREPTPKSDYEVYREIRLKCAQ